MAASFEARKQENERRLRAAERAASATVDAWPSHIVFEFTAACNLRCFMCGFELTRSELRAQGRSRFTLPVEMFHKVAATAFPHIHVVNPTVSGEPFVLPWFDDLVDAVAHYGCKLELITNGMLMSGPRLRRAMPHLASVSVSFDGATRATFEYVRTGGDFARVLENVREFARLRRELGLREAILFTFNLTILRENAHELPQIVEIAAENDVDRVTASYVVVTSEAMRASSPLLDPEGTNAALAAARRRARELGVDICLPKPLPRDAARHIETVAPEPVPEPPSASAGQLASAPCAGPRAAEAAAPGADREAPSMKSAPSADDEAFHASVPRAPRRPGGCAADAASAPTEERPRPTTAPPPNWPGAYYCDMPWRRAFVGLNGELAPCCAPGRPILGNVFEQDFFAIWNGPEYRRLREGLVSGDLTDYCRRCPFLQEAGATAYTADAYVR